MKPKITFTFLVFSVLYTIVIGKALYVQVLNREKLIAYSENQIVRKTKVYPKRGHIVDRNENPLAINVQRYNLFTFAKDVESLQKELYTLDSIVPEINVKAVFAKVKERKKFTWIAREIELKDNQVEKIKELKNIMLESKFSRLYPNHEVAAQLLGFVGIDNDGLAGLEYQFNEKLKGEEEIYKYMRDAKGRPVKFKSTNLDKRAEDIVLSIDKDIQAAVEEYLKEGVEKHEAQSGGAGVINAETGEILAIANYPSYDPNLVKGSSNRKLSFVTDPFEPGSVFKAITIASAIEHNVVRPDTNFYCERGKFRVGNHIINESDSNHVYEWLSVSEILKHSSNIGTTKIAFDLTYPLFKKTLQKFHIGEKTGIEISGESRGILEESENISPIKLSNISFGQGVATTGLQMLASYSAFVNGGFYVKPTILKVTKDEDIVKTRVINTSTATALTKMLLSVVEDGTGANAKVPRFKIAGKTSTAQRVDSKGGYNGYVSGFIGYPVGIDRKFVTFVYIDNPKKGYYGNAVAAPIFQKIVKNILYRDKDHLRLAKSLNNKDFQALDNISMKYSANRKIVKGVAPDLIGLDKSSAFEALDMIDAKYSHTGFGIVSEQSPAAGTIISSNTIIKLKFKAPKYDD